MQGRARPISHPGALGEGRAARRDEGNSVRKGKGNTSISSIRCSIVSKQRFTESCGKPTLEQGQNIKGKEQQREGSKDALFQNLRTAQVGRDPKDSSFPPPATAQAANHELRMPRA